MRPNIEAERAKRMMTKGALSAELGVCQKTYMAYVLGQRAIPSDILIHMADMFQCSIEYLLEER